MALLSRPDPISPDQEAEAEAVILGLRGVPRIGDTFAYAFEYRDGRRDRPGRFRVSCYLKRHVPPPWPSDMPGPVRELFEEMRRKYPPGGHGPDNVPLVVCRRDEAEYVEGVGVCGVIVRVSDVHADGRVDWPEELLASARHHAELLIGEVVR